MYSKPAGPAYNRAVPAIPRIRMSGRDIHEAHRVATPLELFFDLTFVVAIAIAAGQLHHAVVEHHLAQGLLGFVTVFFAIWWAWMNFTWFASAYDTDDAGYRFWTMVQMVGVLILAAGVPQATQANLTTVTIGYVVMRVGLIALWLRAARDHADRRTTSLRYAVGLLVVQVLWVLRLQVPESLFHFSWAVLVIAELAVPVWAARAGHTPWHAHHIAERYGLFTIIVLGESVLSASNAVASVLAAQGWSLELALVGLGAVGLILGLWWVYFLVPNAAALHHHRERAFVWGYGHVLLFASLAALGAFLGVVADQLRAATVAGPDPTLAIGLVAFATAVYLGTIWWLRALITQSGAGHAGIWIGAAAWLAALVISVRYGLSLAAALPLLALAPAAIVAVLSSRKMQ